MQSRFHANHRGSALIIVLAVIGFLSVTLAATLIVINGNMKRSMKISHGLDAHAMAQRGIALGTHTQVKRDDPLLRDISEDGVEGYEVTVTSEGARLNINSVIQRKDKNLMRNLFAFWGMDFDEAGELADALVDWVDRNDVEELNGAERDYYEELGYTDRPYNKPFQSLDDLLLVRGFDQVTELEPTWKEWLTIWGDAELDIHEARPELLAVAADIDLDQAEQFHQEVVAEDGILGTADDLTYASLDTALDQLGSSTLSRERRQIRQRFRVRSDVRRVVSRGWSGDSVKEIMIIVRNLMNRPSVLHYEDVLKTEEYQLKDQGE